METQVCVRLDWQSLGEVMLHRGMLNFPRAARVPAIYWLRIPATDGPGLAYIGQTDSLSRRFGNYRTPGPTQRTSLGINAMLVRTLELGGSIEVLVALQGYVYLDGKEVALEMGSKFQRLLAESAAVVLAHFQGETLANR
jgi:hypothetical protein